MTFHHFRQNIALLAVLALGGCFQRWEPVAPVDPVVPVVPVDPVTPTPIPSDRVATGADAALVVVGMSETNVGVTLKIAPLYRTAQDDGTVLAEYPILDVDGKPKSLIVHFKAGVVIGRVRIPRAP